MCILSLLVSYIHSVQVFPLSWARQIQPIWHHPVRRARAHVLACGSSTALPCGSISGLYKDACLIQPSHSYTGVLWTPFLHRPAHAFTDTYDCRCMHTSYMLKTHARIHKTNKCTPAQDVDLAQKSKGEVLCTCTVKKTTALARSYPEISDFNQEMK